jgi:D-alanyl-D-alanine carboxypeptidase
LAGVGGLGGTPDQHPVPIASLTKVMTAFIVLLRAVPAGFVREFRRQM